MRQRITAALTPGTPEWTAALLGILAGILAAYLISKGYVQVDLHPGAGFIAWHTQNPLIDWTIGRHGADIGLFGHRFGWGAYGSWVPFLSPNGGRYITLFGHTYGWECWGTFGPFSESTS